MTSMNDMLEIMRCHGIPTDRVFAWTICYFPFVMGGSTWQPAGAEVACDEPIWHEGFCLALCHGPDDMTFVVEFTSGAIVGETLEEVKHHIDTPEPGVDMKKQVEQAREKRQTARTIEAEDLWNRLAKARA